MTVTYIKHCITHLSSNLKNVCSFVNTKILTRFFMRKKNDRSGMHYTVTYTLLEFITG